VTIQALWLSSSTWRAFVALVEPLLHWRRMEQWQPGVTRVKKKKRVLPSWPIPKQNFLNYEEEERNNKEKRKEKEICVALSDCGGDSSRVRDRLKSVKAIYSTLSAFTAVLQDGSVETWGMPSRENISLNLIEIIKMKQTLCDIFPCGCCFTGYGGEVPPKVRQRLKQVQSICGSGGAFAALLSDDTVQTWGLKSQFSLLPFLQSFFFFSCFLVCSSCFLVCSSCSSWTDDWFFCCLWFLDGGGDSSSVASQLKEIVLVCASRFAFAALRKDGTVVSWGMEGDVPILSLLSLSLHLASSLSSLFSTFSFSSLSLFSFSLSSGLSLSLLSLFSLSVSCLCFPISLVSWPINNS